MTTAPTLALAGPLTLGPAAGAASSSQQQPPVAFAFPPAFRGSGGGDAGVSYEAYARGDGEDGQLEIVARVGDDVDYVARLGGAHDPATAGTRGGAPLFAALAVPAGGHAPSHASLTLLAGEGGPPAPLAARLRRLEYAVTGDAARPPPPPALADPGAEDGGTGAAVAAAVAGKRGLLATFGSHRAKRRAAARAAGRVDDGALGDEAAAGGLADLVAGAAAAAAAGGATREAAAAAAAAAHPTRPPHDPDATTPHAAYPLHLLTPPGGSAAVDAAAGRLADRVAGGVVAPAPEPPAVKEEGGAGAGGGPPARPPPDEFPPFVLARAAALAAAVDAADAPAAGPDPARRLRALALLAALLRLRGGPRALRCDPARGGMAALARVTGVPDPALLGGLLEALAAPSPCAGGCVAYSWAGAPGAALHLRALATALVAEDGDVAPPVFAALRGELGVGSADLAAAFRELGARAAPAPAGSVPGPHRAYRVRLLAGDGSAGTLGAAFPAIKLGRRAK